MDNRNKLAHYDKADKKLSILHCFNKAVWLLFELWMFMEAYLSQFFQKLVSKLRMTAGNHNA